MIKYIVLSLYSLVLLFFSFFFETNVTMDVAVPETVQAGSSFKVNVTLDKGELESFSRYLQTLPYGLKATSDYSANADFTFKDQKVRLIWLRLPETNTISFSYNVEVDKRLKGEFDLSTMFSYIQNNERQSVNVKSRPVTIIPSPDLSADQIVDIREFEGAVIADLSPMVSDKVSCIRKAPDLTSKNGITIDLIVNKGNKEKFAKIEEQIPQGYNAIGTETKNAIFSFKDGIAKFLWMNLPAESFYHVSYTLIPESGTDPSNLNLKGTFSYIEDEKTISVDIQQEEFELVTKNEQEIKSVFASLGSQKPSSTLASQTKVVPEKTPQTDPEQTKTPSETTLTKTTPVDKTATTSVKTRTSSAMISKSNLLQPETGIYYRVQLAAGHKPVNVGQYFRKYKLDKTVKIEQHEGWRKYSVGSFGVYKEARDYRNYIWKTTDIDDAFVSAYNNGIRITVQEALMIANQKWYK